MRGSRQEGEPWRSHLGPPARRVWELPPRGGKVQKAKSASIYMSCPGEGQPRRAPAAPAQTRRLFSLWEIWGALLGGMGGGRAPGTRTCARAPPLHP